MSCSSRTGARCCIQKDQLSSVQACQHSTKLGGLAAKHDRIIHPEAYTLKQQLSVPTSPSSPCLTQTSHSSLFEGTEAIWHESQSNVSFIREIIDANLLTLLFHRLLKQWLVVLTIKKVAYLVRLCIISGVFSMLHDQICLRCGSRNLVNGG